MFNFFPYFFCWVKVDVVYPIFFYCFNFYKISMIVCLYVFVSILFLWKKTKQFKKITVIYKIVYLLGILYRTLCDTNNFVCVRYAFIIAFFVFMSKSLLLFYWLFSRILIYGIILIYLCMCVSVSFDIFVILDYFIRFVCRIDHPSVRPFVCIRLWA